MVTDWYVKIADKEVGPLSSQQLKIMAKKGQLGAEDLIRQGDNGPWVPAGRVKGLVPQAGAEVSDSTITALPMAKPLEGPVVMVTKGQRQNGDTSTAKPATGRTPATPKKATPLGTPPSPDAIPTAKPTPPEAAQVISDVVPPPPIVGSQIAVPSPVASAAPPRDLIDPAVIRRKKQHQQKMALTGLVAAVAVLAGIALLVISSSGNKSAKSSVSRKSNSATTTADVNPEESASAAGRSDGDGLEGLAASVVGATGGKRGKSDNAWTDAQQDVATLGTVKVRIAAVELGEARFTRSSERCLAVKFELSNTHDSKIRQHNPWTRLPDGALVDDVGNSYQLRSAPQKKESIYPGKSIEETLIFQRPVKKAKVLKLQLPATAFGEDGMLRFQIPVDMIKEVEEIAGGELPPARAVRTPASADGATPPEREEPRISRGIEEAEKPQASQPKKAKDAASDSIDKINQDIEKLDGRRKGKEPTITDFEDDPKMQETIKKMNRQAEPKKTSRRSGGG